MTNTDSDTQEIDGPEIVIRGVNDTTFQVVVDALDAAGVNTEVVRRA